MKKALLVSFLIAMCILGLSVSTLAQSNNQSKDVTLRVVVSPDEGNVIHYYTQEFEQKTGIKVVVDFIGWDKLHDKIVSILAAGGAGYDVVFIPSANAVEFPTITNFVPLDNLIANKAEWLQSVLDLYTYKGHLIAIPWYSGGAHMLYNSAYLAQAGVDPKNVITWDDFLGACQKVKDAGVVKYPFIPSAKYPGNYYFNWGSIVASMGGKILDDNSNPVFNQGAGLEALKVLVQGTQMGLFNPAGIAMDDYETMKAFAAGDTAFLLDSTWSATQATLPNVSKVAKDAKVMPIPGSKDHRTGGLLYAGGFGILESSKHQTEAKQYIMFLTGKEPQLMHAILGANVPTRVSLFSGLEKDAIEKGWPIYGALVKQIQVGEFGPSITWLDPLRRDLATAVQDALAGRKTAEEALDWAANEALQLRKTYGG